MGNKFWGIRCGGKDFLYAETVETSITRYSGMLVLD